MTFVRIWAAANEYVFLIYCYKVMAFCVSELSRVAMVTKMFVFRWYTLVVSEELDLFEVMSSVRVWATEPAPSFFACKLWTSFVAHGILEFCLPEVNVISCLSTVIFGDFADRNGLLWSKSWHWLCCGDRDNNHFFGWDITITYLYSLHEKYDLFCCSWLIWVLFSSVLLFY